MEPRPMIRSLLQVIATCLLLAASYSPAFAAYKMLIKGPICPTSPYCYVEFNYSGSNPVGPISITLPAYTPASGPSFPGGTFTGNINVISSTSQVCNQGTKGNLEWLDAGSNVHGLSAVLNSTIGTDTYTLTLSYATQASGEACNQKGNETLLYTRSYTLSKNGRSGGTVTGSGTYFVYNIASVIPEPKTLLLLLAGLGAMGIVTWRKRR